MNWGFDVVLYNNEDSEIGLYDLTEILHNEIFNSKKL